MKKNILTLFVSCMAFFAVQAQDNPSCGCPYTRLERKFVEQENISLIVDVPASFTGGEMALRRYEQRLIQNPAQNAADSAKYNILCRFVVEKNGKVSHVELLNNPNPTYENEARRFIQTMPRWVPAQKDSMAVSSWHLMRLYFGQPEETAASTTAATAAPPAETLSTETAALNITKQSNIINNLAQ